MAPSAAGTTQQHLVLPTLVFGLVEARRLQRELEALSDYYEQSRIRGAAAGEVSISRLLDALARENHVNLQHAAERQILHNFLHEVIEKAPTIHVSFATDPSAGFTAKLVAWLRGNIHPYALLQLGLQPSIAAGCIVRTPNQVFDFSLRQHLSAKRELLTQALGGQPQP